MMKMNFDTLFNGVNKKSIPVVSIDGATMGLVRGLEHFIGQDYTWLPAYDRVAKWLQNNEKKGLLMVGGNGTGKTTMEKIIKRILEVYFENITGKQVTCMFTSVYKIKDAWDYYSPYQIIDDLGKETISKTFGEVHDYFTQIIDRAEQSGQLLICSSNLTKEELHEKYDGRTLDRMRALFKTVFFEGQSMRR